MIGLAPVFSYLAGGHVYEAQATQNQVAITSLAAKEGTDQTLTVGFTGPSSTTAKQFVVHLYYEKTINDHSYRVERCADPISAVDQDGYGYTCDLAVPANVDAACSFHAYVVMQNQDGTTVESEDREVDAMPQRTSVTASNKLTVTIPKNTEKGIEAPVSYVFYYDPGQPEGQREINTFGTADNHSEVVNGVCFDQAKRELTISGGYNAIVEQYCPYEGCDLNKIILNNAQFEKIDIKGQKPVSIELIDTSTGNICLDSLADVCITSSSGDSTATLTGNIDAKSASTGSELSNCAVIMSNISYSVQTAEDFVLRAGSIAFDTCKVKIDSQSTSASSVIAALDGNGTGAKKTLIDGNGIMVRNCSSFEVKGCENDSIVSSYAGGILFDGSTATVSRVDDKINSLTDNPQAVYCHGDSSSGTCALELKNKSALSVNMTEDYGAGSYTAIDSENVTIEKGSTLTVAATLSEYAEKGVSSLHAMQVLHDFDLYGTANLTVANSMAAGELGTGGIRSGTYNSSNRGVLTIDGGELNVSVKSKGYTQGIFTNELNMNNNAIINMAIEGNEGPDDSGQIVDAFVGDSSNIAATIKNSVLNANIYVSGKGAVVRGMHFGSTKLADSECTIGIHNGGGTLSATGNEVISTAQDPDVSNTTVVCRVPNSMLTVASNNLKLISGAKIDLAACICTGQKIGNERAVETKECVKLSGDFKQLSVKLPKSIIEKATLPDTARLMAVRGSESGDTEIWSGKLAGTTGTIAAYASAGELYRNAKLQVMLNGAWTTVAKYDSDFLNSGSITLSTEGCTDFWYVTGVEVKDTGNLVVAPSDYKATVAKNDDTHSWVAPGFFAAGDYKVTLAATSSATLYDIDSYNNDSSKGKCTLNKEGVIAVDGLVVIQPSSFYGTVKESGDDGSLLQGARVTASQTLKNGYTYSTTALTGKDGGYTLQLYDSSNVDGQTTYTLSYASYQLTEGSDNSVSKDTPTADGLLPDFTMASQSVPRIGLTWSLDISDDDTVTSEYANGLSQGFTLGGTVANTALANSFKGNVVIGSGVYDLWSNEDAKLLQPEAGVSLSVDSGAFVFSGADSISASLDSNRTATVDFKITPRAGVRVTLQADVNKAVGPHVAQWYKADGSYIGASEGSAMVSGAAQAVSLACPENTGGTYTVVYAPSGYVAQQSLDQVDASIERSTVTLVKSKGTMIESTVRLKAASSDNALYITQPNSTISAPENRANDSDLIAIPCHLEADADVEEATTNRITFDTRNGSTAHCTLFVNYISIDSNGDGQTESFPVNIDAAGLQYIDFDTSIGLPIDFTLYCQPNGDADCPLTVLARVNEQEGQLVGSATISRPGATIQAPLRTSTAGITVSGTAPSGKSVCICDDTSVIGTVTADAKGNWSTTVGLASPGNNASVHTLCAKSSGVVSATTDVIYNSTGAALQRTGMYLDGSYYDARASYTWKPSHASVGMNVMLESEIANPDALRTEYSPNGLSAPVIFAVQLINGEVKYYDARQSASNTTIFQSDSFKVYSPISNIAVMYQSKDDPVVTKDSEGYATSYVDVAELNASLASQTAAVDKDTQARALEDQGLAFTQPTADQAKLSGPDLVNQIRASQKQPLAEDTCHFVAGARPVAKEVFEADLAYAKGRSEQASLKKADVKSGEDTVYTVWSFYEESDADGNGKADSAFVMQLVIMPPESGSETPSYYETVSLNSATEARLPGTTEPLGVQAAESDQDALSAQSKDNWVYDPKKDGAFINGLRQTAFATRWDTFEDGWKLCLADLRGDKDFIERVTNYDSWIKQAETLLNTPCYKNLPDDQKAAVMDKIAAFNYTARTGKKMNGDILIGRTVIDLLSSAVDELPKALDMATKIGDKAADSIQEDFNESVKIERDILFDEVRKIFYKNGVDKSIEDCIHMPSSDISTTYKPSARIDPSGYVYEAVPSNTVDGATVTLFQNVNGVKTKIETGNDSITPAQNPLTTDADGRYEWFVPEGKWLVEVSKDGYEGNDSQKLPESLVGKQETINDITWLKVLPPQTQVNIGITNSAAPYIKDIHAAPEGVFVEFSRYMDEETLKVENFIVGDQAPKSITTLDHETDPTTGKSYTSKVLLESSTGTFEVGKNAVVNVTTAVKSYAGTSMATQYSNSVPVYVSHTLSAKNAGVTGAALDTAGTRYVEGSRVTLTAADPQAGFDFSGWEVKGAELTLASTETVSFEMPNTDVTVTALYTGSSRGVRPASDDGPAWQVEMTQNNSKVAVVGDQVYSGSALTPTPIVMVNGVLVDPAEYTVTYEGDHINVGTATVKVTGKGNYYTGSATGTFAIIAKTYGKPTWEKTTYDYTGSEIALGEPSGFDSGAMTVSNDKAKAPGTYKAVIALKDKANTAWADGTTTDISVE
jgi:hypothetical protein